MDYYYVVFLCLISVFFFIIIDDKNKRINNLQKRLQDYQYQYHKKNDTLLDQYDLFDWCDSSLFF